MKKVTFAAMAATALLMAGVTACNKNEAPAMVEEQPTTPTVLLSDTELRVLHQLRGENNRISFDEAAEIALGAFGSFGSPSGGSSLAKSAPARRIGSVKVLRTEARGGSSLAKSVGDAPADMSDTIAYVFNFENESGFAVVAADVRVEEPLLAYCDNGSLGDTIDNPGLALFLEGAGYYVERSIAEGQRLRDSMLADILAKIWENGVVDTIYQGDATCQSCKSFVNEPSFDELSCKSTPDVDYSYGNWQVTERVGPLLPVEWHQRAPFNNNLNIGCPSNNGNALAGCVAIAAAQLMAYWRHPANLNGRDLDWALLSDYTAIAGRYSGAGSKTYVNTTGAEVDRFREQVAYLVRRVGVNVHMDYGCERSRATSSDAVEFLRSVGYKYGVSGYFNEKWELGLDYDYGKVKESLNNRRPVYISGYSHKTEHSLLGIKWNTYSKGHAWIIDGYLARKRSVKATTTVYRPAPSGWVVIALPPTLSAKAAPRPFKPCYPVCISSTSVSNYTQSASYLHNNWGWGNSSRGNYSNGDIRYTNGYYLIGCFNSVPGPSLPSNTLAKSGQDKNYQYDIEIFPNIHK